MCVVLPALCGGVTPAYTQCPIFITTLDYRCGSEDGWSDIFWFIAKRMDKHWAPALAVYGDLGSTNAQSLPRLQTEVATGAIDAVLHIGDFAYDMEDVSMRNDPCLL